MEGNSVQPQGLVAGYEVELSHSGHLVNSVASRARQVYYELLGRILGCLGNEEGHQHPYHEWIRISDLGNSTRGKGE